MIPDLFNQLAIGTGWTLLLGLAFWCLTASLSYIWIGLRKLDNLRKTDPDEPARREVQDQLDQARALLDEIRNDRTKHNH